MSFDDYDYTDDPRWAQRFGKFATFSNSPNDPTSLNFAGTAQQRISDIIRRGYGNDVIDFWTEYETRKKNNVSTSPNARTERSTRFTPREPATPDIFTEQVSENAAVVTWNPRSENTTGYRFVLKNEDTGQTVKQNKFLKGTTNAVETNLESGTTYKAFITATNEEGESEETTTTFRTSGAKVFPTTLSQESIDIIEKFDSGIYQIQGNYPLTLLIESLKSGKMTNEDFIGTVKANLEFGQFVDTSMQKPLIPDLLPEVFAETQPPEGFHTMPDGSIMKDSDMIVDKSINSMMVSQSIGAFILKDGRVRGEILYIANQSFNPYYYGKNLTSLVQIKSKSGVVLAIKSNNVNFTETQRDERIQIDESSGNFKELIIDFFIWDSPVGMKAFSENKQIQVVEELPVDDPNFAPCPSGFHKDFSGKCVADDPVGEVPRDKLIDTLKGFLFGTVALSLLARKY